MVKQLQGDDELWDSFKSGDHNFFARLYQLHYRSLFSYGKNFLADETSVEDAIQDLFITLWRTRANLSPVANVKYYLFRSLRRELHRLSDRQKRFERVDMDTLLASYDLPLEASAPGDEDELAGKLAGILKKLPKRQYEAILLRYYEDFSILEIATLMGISAKTVRNTLFNALTQLRQDTPLLTVILVLLFYIWL